MSNNQRAYNYYTFDVFDTLVIRNAVKPVDVFAMAGGGLFRYARIAAEIISRRISKEEDVTLDEIYRFLPKKLKEKEIAAELEVCIANPSMFELYQKLKAQGKKIYAISDMYLPKSVIENILKQCGYELDGIYVSSDIMLSKTTGNLFKYFLRENNLNPAEVLHIGDNEVSDIESAERVGMQALHVAKCADKLTYMKRNRDMFLRGFVNRKLNETDDRCEQIGWEVLGPVLVSFCQWIHAQKKHFGFDKLFFLSRDMHIVYDAYKMMYGDEGIDYLQISRKSLHNALQNHTGLCTYLKNKGCVGNGAVVDTGWRCVAQPIIEYYAKMVEPSSDIGGLYLGAKTGFNYIRRSEKSASCFYRTKLDLIRSQTYSSLIECFLGYRENKVLDYDADGNPLFNHEQKSVARIETIQRSGLQFVAAWLSETNNREILPDCAFKPYKEMQNFPLTADIDLVGDSEYDDVKTTRLVKYDAPITKNVKEWLNNLRFSAWKGAYFKRSFRFFKPFYFGYLVLDSLYLAYLDKKSFNGKGIDYLLDYYK